jgi:hypothetical protein
VGSRRRTPEEYGLITSKIWCIHTKQHSEGAIHIDNVDLESVIDFNYLESKIS